MVCPKEEDHADEDCRIRGSYEILATMRQREDKFYRFESFAVPSASKVDGSGCVGKKLEGRLSEFDKGMLPEEWRRELCEWITNSIEAFDVEELGFTSGREVSSSSLSSLTSIASYAEELAFSFMDRFLATLPVATRCRSKACHAVALVSTHLAYSLVSGSRYMSLPFSALLTLLDCPEFKNKISSEELAATHCAMLRALRFKVHPPLTNEYLVLFRQLLQNFVDSRDAGDSLYRCLQPSQCDFLIEQAHFMSELSLKESCFVTVPKHTVAFVALGVMMEYTFPISSSKEAEFSQAFLRHLGAEMNLDILNYYLDGASHWKVKGKTTDTKSSFSDTSGTRWNHKCTGMDQDAKTAHEIRIVRTLLWKLVLEQPSIASTIDSAFCEASQIPQVAESYEENTGRGYSCPSPQSVANFPFSQGGEGASDPLNSFDDTGAPGCSVMKKAPTPKLHGLQMKHLLWWECYIEDCKGLVNKSYIPHSKINTPAQYNTCQLKDNEIDLPDDLYAPDFNCIENKQSCNAARPEKSVKAGGGKSSFSASSVSHKRRSATSNNGTSGKKRRTDANVDHKRCNRRSIESVSKADSSLSSRLGLDES